MTIKIRVGNSHGCAELFFLIENYKYLILGDKFNKGFAGVAQSVEQLICNQQVAGSSPIASSSFEEYIGGVPERSKGADCKSAGQAYGGSKPPPSTSFLVLKRE